MLAAVGGVAVAVFTHGAARANWLAGIGIGAGAATTAWGWSNPSATNNAYRLGAYRAVCLRQAGAGLDDTPGARTLEGQIKLVMKDEDDVKLLQQSGDFVAQLTSPTAASAVAATQVQDAVGVALSLADSAIQAAQQELADYQQRSVLVYAALQKIDSQVYAAVKGSTIDYSTTVAAIAKLAASVPASCTTQAGPAVAPVITSTALNTASATQKLQQALANLIRDTKILAATKSFSTAVTKIDACMSASD
jgi:hypothetical protein